MDFFDVENIMSAVRTEVTEELQEKCSDIFDKSQELVPVGKTGVLKESGYIDSSESTPSRITFEIGYDTSPLTGKPFNYALIRHELVPKDGSGIGMIKYLERPFNASTEGIYGGIRRAMLDGISEGTHYKKLEV